MKSLLNGANDGFWVPVTALTGTLRLWPWTKCEADGEPGTRGYILLRPGKQNGNPG